MARFEHDSLVGLIDHQAASFGTLAEGSSGWQALLDAISGASLPLWLSRPMRAGVGGGPSLFLRGFGAAASTAYDFKVWGVLPEYATADERNAGVPSSAMLSLVGSGIVNTGSTAEAAGRAAAGLYPAATLGSVTAGASQTTAGTALSVGAISGLANGLLLLPDVGMYAALVLESDTGLKWSATRFG